ncbi:exported protein of unknown function [Xenorhabdus bovienii]|uniref:Uncharacterized protein n=1 Tax=Xenorhabdus bovienii TaxID=40576 RepID=A0A0B6XG05_XENBV|nr:exported protein of unknown function [Xenorhabdus bovienii]
MRCFFVIQTHNLRLSIFSLLAAMAHLLRQVLQESNQRRCLCWIRRLAHFPRR